MSRAWWRIVAMLGADWPRAALAVVLLVATLVASLALMGTSAWLIATAALHPSVAALQVAIVGVRFFGITRGIARYCERLVSHDVTLRLLERLRVAMFSRLLPLAPAGLVFHRTGDLVARLLGDVETLEHAFVRVLSPSLAALAIGALLTGSFGLLAWPLAVVVAAVFFAGGLLAPFTASWLGARSGRRLVAERGRLEADLLDGIGGVGELLAFGRAADHVARIARQAAAVEGAEIGAARAAATSTAATMLAIDLGVVAAAAVAIPLVAGGDMSGVSLAVVLLVLLASVEAIGMLASAWQGLGASDEAARRVDELTPASSRRRALPTRSASPPAVGGRPGSTRPSPSTSPPSLGSTRREPAPARTPRFEVAALAFAYPGGPPVLSDVSLTLEPGHLAAIVGASGSGKSTLLNLALRFWDGGRSCMWLDGVDVCDLDPDAVRAAFSVMPQRTHLVTATVADNLRLAAPDASDTALEQALARAGLGTWVRTLPNGLDEWVGDQGVRLSGGERQRLAFARALLRPAPFMLLDEPTAHLDGAMERHVLDEIANEARLRGVMLITHRLVGLETADEVIVLDRGRIVERGPYRSLLEQGGALAALHALERDAL